MYSASQSKKQNVDRRDAEKFQETKLAANISTLSIYTSLLDLLETCMFFPEKTLNWVG